MQPPSLAKSLIRYAILAAVLAAILFLVSGRLGWIRAWLFIAITTGIQIVVGVMLHRKHPELVVERRAIQPGTKWWDKLLVPIIALIGPLAIWAAAAFDARRHWPLPVPISWSVPAFLVCAFAAVLTARAMMANPFFSGTVRIQTERHHAVVDQGPYALLRHPGYSGALAFTLASPIALGSFAALIPAVLTAAVLILRTALEDATLQAELPGYKAYAARVTSRLVPGIW